MSPKRVSRLPLLGILCVALILICMAGLFIWLKGGGRRMEEGSGGRMEGRNGTWKEEGKAEDGEKTSPKAEETKTTMMIRTEEEPEEVVRGGQAEDEEPGGHAPICEIGKWTKTEAGECGGGEGEGRKGELEEMGMKPEPEWGTRPLEYALNISLSESAQNPNLAIRLSILAQLTRDTATIHLHCGHQIGVKPEEVRVWHCSSTDSPSLCVPSSSSFSHSSSHHRLLLIRLFRPLPSGSFVRIQFPLLRLPLSAPNPALFLQIPSAWERDRAWMIGSQFPLVGGIRAVIPSIDIPSARAVFRLCAIHSKQISVRSNSPLASSSDHPSAADHPSSSVSLISCFHDTPPLPPSQFAFLFFRNLASVLPSSASVLPSSALPSIEFFIGSHLNPFDYEWAIEESKRTMERMRELSGIGYPMRKLTLVSSPLSHDSLGGLGLIHIRDTWMEYPKFVHTHELLAGQLIRQWTANVLSLCDRCFQRGLGVYLEWRIGAELAGEGQEEAEFRRRFGEVREKLMATEGREEAIGKEEKKAEADGDGQTQKRKAQKCAEKVAVILHMLNTSFGTQKMSEFIGRLFLRFGWKKQCTPTSELSKLFAESGEGSPEARRVFDSFLLPPSASVPPLVHIRVLPGQSLLRLSQSSPPSVVPPSIPIEIIDDTRKSVRLILNSTQLDVPFVVSSFALSQPNTFARFVYNVENYERLAQCSGRRERRDNGEGCPTLQRNTLQNAWDDMCWALFAGKLIPAEDVDADQRRQPADSLSAWHSLFRGTLSERNGTVRGDCACCMQTKERAMGGGNCRWIWMDKCEKIGILVKNGQ